MPAEVSDEIRSEIARLYFRERRSPKELAARFGVTTATIHNIVREQAPRAHSSEKKTLRRDRKRMFRVPRRVLRNRRLVQLRTIAAGLRSPSFLRRIRTLEQLTEDLLKQFYPEVVLLLRDSHWMVRRTAVRQLASLKDPRLTPAFAQLLADKSKWVRIEVIRSLRIADNREAFLGPLAKLLSQEADPDVRAELLYTLAHFDLNRTGEILLDHLPRERDAVQKPVLEALLAHRPEHPATWVILMRVADSAQAKVRRFIFEEVARHPSEEAALLIGRMFQRERSAANRLDLALHILTHYPELHDVLAAALRRDRVLRHRFLHALARQHTSQKKELFRRMSCHSLPFMRALAVRLLVREKARWAKAPLEKLRHDTDERVRRRATRALSAAMQEMAL